MSRGLPALLAIGVVIGTSQLVACRVHDYCLACEQGDGGRDGNGSGDGGGPIDAHTDAPLDADMCLSIGQACPNQVGACAGGVFECTMGHQVCSKNAAPEQCNGVDDDCDGVVDNGDPGGGGLCASGVGTCVQGTNHCVGGTIQCVGAIGPVAEICDGLDNDCDGTIDEGLTNLGPCGTSSVGICQLGTLMCQGGTSVCVGAVNPGFEICNGLDDDCDGTVDEGFNLQTDPNNCGSCNHVCGAGLPGNGHAIWGCAVGSCKILSCTAGFHDNNNDPTDGCEFGTCFITGAEICDGVDNDCDGIVDEGLGAPPAICATKGECAGTVATCTGAGGYKCFYGPTVSTDATHTNLIPETLCDGKDNDCNGIIDDNQPPVAHADGTALVPQGCNDGQLGICRSTGSFQCDGANLTGPAVCVITSPGGTPQLESCNNLDDDCDGVIDNIGEANGGNTGNLDVGNPSGGQDWVTIPGSATQIMKWEASRADATAAQVGAAQTIVCSKQGVQPWTDVTYPQALAACQAVGARLCTEAEWQSMCAQPGTVTYPVAGPSGATDYVFIEAENAFANTGATFGGTARTWATDTTSNFSGVKDLIATPNTNPGTSPTAAQAPTQSPRLDFQINFQSTGTYFVWVRMFGDASNDNAVFVGINPTTPGTANSTIVGNNNNQIGQWAWNVSAAITVSATGNQFVSVYMREDGTRVDAIAISKDGTDLPPFDDDIWAYQTSPKLPQPQVCNDQEFDTNPGLPGNQDDILPTGSMPACFANGGSSAADAFDMSGNVAEWCNARAAGQNPIRGGTSDTDVTGTSCTLDFTLADNTFFFPNVGFRCCR